MKFYLVQDGKETNLPVYKCKRPLFKKVNGRVWETSDVLVNNEKASFCLDTAYGINVFFELGGQWYKLKFDTTDYYIRLFEPTLANIVTKD